MRVLLQVVVPDGMLRGAAERGDHRVEAVVFHAHQGGLAELLGPRADRGQQDHRPASKVSALLPVRGLIELGLFTRPRRGAGLVVTL